MKSKQTRNRVQCHFTEPSLTKQSFKDECNINKIMARFQKTGAITHYAKHAPEYGDATGLQLLDAQMIIINAQAMFDDLPSSIRKKFDNDPAKFLDFVQDEKNHDEMIKLGLKDSPIVQQADPDTTQSDPVSTSTKLKTTEKPKDADPAPKPSVE